jgi:hypothetical protein
MNKRQRKKRDKKNKKILGKILTQAIVKGIYAAQAGTIASLLTAPPKFKEGGIVPKGELEDLPDQVIPHEKAEEFAKAIKGNVNVKIVLDGIDL